MVGAFPLALPTNRGGQGITYMEATPAELGGPGMDCRTSPWGIPATLWAQRGPRSDTKD